MRHFKSYCFKMFYKLWLQFDWMPGSSMHIKCHRLYSLHHMMERGTKQNQPWVPTMIKYMLVKSAKWESIQIEHLVSKDAEPDKIIFQWPKDILDYQGPSLIKNNPSLSGQRWRSGFEGWAVQAEGWVFESQP